MSWITRFPGLSSLPEDLRNRLVARSQVVRVPKGTELFGPGKAPDALLLLLEGQVLVHQTAQSGREVVLYRVGAGESCVLTTACLLAYENYSAQGVAESDLEAVRIPRDEFDALMAASAEFRAFVFTAYSRRITDLFQVIEEIAFRRMDIRLAQKLVDMDLGDGHIRITHQALADELGTAREVVSRQLQEFQRRGWIAQSRGQIDLKGQEHLSRLARS